MSTRWQKPPSLTGKVIVSVQVEAKSLEAVDELTPYYKSVKEWTLRPENDCLLYKVARFENKLLATSEWKDNDAWTRYLASSEFKNLKQAVDRFATHNPTIGVYEDLI